MAISRRDLFGVTIALTSAQWLRGQTPAPPKTTRVLIRVTVTETLNRYVTGLAASDFRVFEDDIPQKIATFAVGSKPPMILIDDGTKEQGRMAVPPQQMSDRERIEFENTYTITYFSDPSNKNQEFRRFKIQIAPDLQKQWTVRHRTGYQPDRPPAQ